MNNNQLIEKLKEINREINKYKSANERHNPFYNYKLIKLNIERNEIKQILGVK